MIEDCVKKSAIAFDQWERHYHRAETKAAVESDFDLAKKYQIQGVPCLVADGQRKISGAQPLAKIIELINSVTETKAPTRGPSC